MKVMIVDDSIVYRSAISQALEHMPEVEVVKTASNGKIAIEFLKQETGIELITLDMEMPVLDGIETIKAIRKFNTDVSIIVFSSFTTRGAEKTIDALHSGADDFVAKIEGDGNIEGSIKMIEDELLPRIKALTERKYSRSHIEDQINKPYENDFVDVDKLVDEMMVKPKLICIGCSTGGPEALATIFREITEVVTVPMLLVQHMPPMFTEKLAEMLSKLSPVKIKEAKFGDKLEPGICYIAPGDYHMELSAKGEITLNQNEKVCFVRPSVDVLFRSIARNFKEQVMAITLTGMGDDGANGSAELKKNGCYHFIQDESSSIVWGMPGAVQKSGIEPVIVNLDKFGKLLNLVSKRV
ncbi:hypothetical protein A9Q84_07070 [Halobacteriovorax marinus]|mgnify:CR=1 FL=1|uniref:Protein-glutamate methylesterase/protein-glutamine glutaminase n=1 Tax=Halobacteriovorax marinus TaxID=97084 RepID=A0A1Y5F5F7_9BACT|nr:hypothetical protein A9Q84_07070 [Halobacteriovorax marinus]